MSANAWNSASGFADPWEQRVGEVVERHMEEVPSTLRENIEWLNTMDQSNENELF